MCLFDCAGEREGSGDETDRSHLAAQRDERSADEEMEKLADT